MSYKEFPLKFNRISKDSVSYFKQVKHIIYTISFKRGSFFSIFTKETPHCMPEKSVWNLSVCLSIWMEDDR